MYKRKTARDNFNDKEEEMVPLSDCRGIIREIGIVLSTLI